MNAQKELLAMYPEAEASPEAFALKVLNLTPTGQQADFFRALAEPGARVAVRSGHGTGKSTALAVAALWFLATREDALVPCTAPTAHQLHDVLWRELRRLVRRMPEGTRERFQATSDRIRMEGSAGMIVARTARPENPDALQGFHAPEILFIIDEAAGVANAVFEVARGALSTPSARVALAGNPTRLSGYFHNAFHSARETWNRLVFSCLDSPLVDPEFGKGIAAEYGEGSDMYRVRVLGEFPECGARSLISRKLVEASMARRLPATMANRAPLVIGLDPAWLGEDRSAAVWRRGVHAGVLFGVRSQDTLQLAELMACRAAELLPDMIFVDQTGVGAGVYDLLKRTGHPVTGVSFAQTPLNPDRYFNRRAEIWCRVKDWLDAGGVLDGHADLKADLIGPEYRFTGVGKIQLEAKEEMRARGLPSPDYGDALALTFSMDVYPRSPAVAAGAAERYGAYDWMRRN